MNSYSLNVGSCSCLVNDSVEDFLRCAPCPPPTMTYKKFRDHARNQTLETKDICIISKRCFGNSTVLTADCPPSLFMCPETTTIDTTTKPPPYNVLGIVIILAVIFLASTACVILIGCIYCRKRQDSKCPSKLTCFEKYEVKKKRKEITSKMETLEHSTLLPLSKTPESSPKTQLLESSNTFSESQTSIIDLQAMRATYSRERSINEKEQIPESKNISKVIVDIHKDLEQIAKEKTTKNLKAILGEPLEPFETDLKINASEGDDDEHRNDHKESLTDDTEEDDQAVFENKGKSEERFERFESVNESVEEKPTISLQLISKESGQPLESSNSDLEYESANDDDGTPI